MNRTSVYIMSTTLFGFDWYQWAMLIYDWGSLGLWGFAAIVQLLANFGVLNNLNLITWLVILPIGWLLVDTTVFVFMYLAYDMAFDEAETNSNSTVMEWVMKDIFALMVHEGAIAIGLLMNMDEWFMANYMRLPEETRRERRGEEGEKPK